MSEPFICCPTHGRAGSVTTFQVLGHDLPLIVARSQEEAYRDAYPEAVIHTHPDSVVGLSGKRQWIYEQYGDVFMVDDDLDYMGDQTPIPGPGITKARVSRNDPERVRDVIRRAHDMAEDVGAFFYGFNQYPDPATFISQNPIHLSGYIGGHAMGLRAGSKLYWPRTGMHGSEDMWISALNAYHHRIALIDMRYVFPQLGTLVSRGGLAEVRTLTNLEENYKTLVKTFGSKVIVKKSTGQRSALKHRWQIALQLPF
jgi:hypothetical protein